MADGGAVDGWSAALETDDVVSPAARSGSKIPKAGILLGNKNLAMKDNPR